MRAICLNGQQLEFHSDVAEPKPVSGEAVVRIVRAGICSTDLELVKGYMGFGGILGHEFVGIAESGKFAGQRVVGEINCCLIRDCQGCASFSLRHCPERTVLGILNRDGAFADRVAIPETNLFVVPETISTDEAVFVEPLAAAFEILAQVEMTPADNVAILGDGRLAYLCAQVIAGVGGDVVVVGKHPEKLELFERLKLANLHTQQLETIEDSKDKDYVVDCTGSNSGMETAYRLVKPRGTIVLKTTVAGTPTFSLAPIVIDEIRVVGSRCGLFPPAIQALEEKSIDVLSLISKRFPLESAIEAFELCQQPGTKKVLFDVSDDPAKM